MSFSPSRISISTSSLKNSTAFRRSFELNESLLRLPEIARTFVTSSGRLHQLELGDDRHIVRKCGITGGEGRVPIDAEVGPVDAGGELQSEALVPVRVRDRLREGAGHLDGLRDALDRDLTRDGDRLAVEVDLLGDEAKRRKALRVEEVGRLQMGGEVLVLDVDARDLRAALDAGTGVGDAQLGLHVAELAAESAGEVVDLEADGRMHRIEIPRPGRNLC